MKTIRTACCQDCGGACPLNVVVENGRIIKIESRDVGYPSLRACSRGILYHYRVYARDRLLHPLKRVGERGAGSFVPISWDEALDTISRNITRIRDRFGPAAIFNLSFGGSSGRLHYPSVPRNFFSLAGGQSTFWGGASYQGGLFSNLATFGQVQSGNDRADLLNSKMIVLWGCNPAESIFGSETRWYLMQAKEKGTRIVCIDPRYTETASSLANEWVPIRPGADAAMAVAMAHAILKEDLHDQQFLERCTIGFEKFRDYVLGQEDGEPKTPEWAEKICGVPAGTIHRLAVEYVVSKPAAIVPGFGPGRSSAGEQFHRTTSVLAAMTGNTGISGGSSAGLDLGFGAMPVSSAKSPMKYADLSLYIDIPQHPNPVESDQPLHEYSIGGIRQHTVDKVHPSKVWDAILDGKAGGYPSDIKMLFVQCGDPLNQLPDCNKGAKALDKLQFMVVHDMFLTPTARYADIVLPVCTWLERNDIRLPWFFGYYALFCNKAIEPLGECKTDLEIFTELANRMGLKGFEEKTEEEWLRFIAAKHGISDFESFKSTGFFKLEDCPPHVSFHENVRDPANHPFPTPSGRIEIFSQRIAEFGRPHQLPPIPKFVNAWEGPEDPLRQKYPLQLITTHSRKRTNSQFHGLDWFQDQEQHQVWINPIDARSRGIGDGDRVNVFNERGAVPISAKVTERIIPGTVCIYQGTWYDPDESGKDRGGCANLLTRAEHSPGGAFCSNSALVEVTKT